MREIPITMLGQAGVLLHLPGGDVAIDPYLSDSVARTFGSELTRLKPAPLRAEALTGVAWVLVSHEHLDHLDPESLTGIALASPAAQVVCPSAWHPLLREASIPPERIHPPPQSWRDILPGVRIRAIPAAHPSLDVDEFGEYLRVGYAIDVAGCLLYHAGDTSPHSAIVEALAACGRPRYAFLPVNERNYYRDRAGIIGNMSVREALQFADEIGADHIVPIHWDLFAPNSVPAEEIRVVHRVESPHVRLLLEPASLPPSEP